MARDVPQNYRELVIRQQTVVRNGAQRQGRDLQLETWARNTPNSSAKASSFASGKIPFLCRRSRNRVHTLAAATNDTALAAR